jgi:hypothetical protein
VADSLWVIGASMTKFTRYKDKDLIDLGSEAGARQIDGVKVGLTHVIGLGSACAVHILEKAA